MLFIMDDLKQNIMSYSFHLLWFGCVGQILSNIRFKQTLIEIIIIIVFFFLSDKQQSVLCLIQFSDSGMEEPSRWVLHHLSRQYCK